MTERRGRRREKLHIILRKREDSGKFKRRSTRSLYVGTRFGEAMMTVLQGGMWNE